MIDKKLLQRKTDSFVVHARELSSRGTSFLLLMIGMILQASHTTLLMYHVSAFESNIIKFLVSFGIGIFVSGALAVFTLKSDGKNKDLIHIINVFFYFEIFTNIFYYWNSLIFTKGFENATPQDWLYLIVTMPFAYIVPFTIKKFAGSIRTEETLIFGSLDILPKEENKEVEVEKLNEIIENNESLILEDEAMMKEQIERLNEIIGNLTEENKILNQRVDNIESNFEKMFNDRLSKLESQFIKKGESVKVKTQSGSVGDLQIINE